MDSMEKKKITLSITQIDNLTEEETRMIEDTLMEAVRDIQRLRGKE